jgi:hypothetical protein
VTSARTEIPIGSIITVVAVLLTHIDSPAVASMNPPTIRRGRVPTARSVSSATRRCSPHRCIASASTNPPRNRNTSGFAYALVVAVRSSAPVIGSSTIGSSEVTASGSDSHTHHVAINTATAAVARPPSVNPPGPVGTARWTATASAGPSHRPIRARRPTRVGSGPPPSCGSRDPGRTPTDEQQPGAGPGAGTTTARSSSVGARPRTATTSCGVLWTGDLFPP